MNIREICRPSGLIRIRQPIFRTDQDQAAGLQN